MRAKQWTAALAGAALLACACGIAAAEQITDIHATSSASESASPPTDPAALEHAGIETAPPKSTTDPCAQTEVVASPSRPYWDGGAATTQCGIIEVDFGWLGQSMGGGVRQWMLASSLRYGLTPKMDLRWGVINHISQSGGGTAPLEGIGDQSLSATYRFYEQGRWMPAMALSYGIEIPTGNPAKGFGSGFIDQGFVFLASRDVGKIHLDFNTVGTVTGGTSGHDGSAQFGLAATRQMTKKLALILESYGGPQPEATDKYGAALTGASYSVRPWLVVDGAYVRTYTGGSPRQEFLFGLTHSIRPRFEPISKRSAIARKLGR